MSTLKPRAAVPLLNVATSNGERWDLAAQRPRQFTMIVFYRGLHCPVCKAHLRDLDRKLGEFAEHGVDVVAISTDEEARARQAQEDWGLTELRLGYGLTIDAARQWGLFISTSRGKTSAGIDEPAQFSEPGLFLVRSDGTLYFSSVQTMPFARPHFDEILRAVAFVIDKDYPARGEA